MSLPRFEKRRLDYKSPDFTITDIDLTFYLDYENTIVKACSKVVRKTQDLTKQLVLDGDDLELLKVLIDNKECEYINEGTTLTISNVPNEFELTIETRINPRANSKLMGLYVSDNKFCTQNEPEGFRRITYFLDRSDVLARYTTHIHAPKDLCPFMLSNGNCISDEIVGDERVVTWVDPFPKPSYLFALVAGDFDELQDTFVTKSGRNVKVKLYVDKGKASQGKVAIESILKSMKWDEERFDLEYDLDNFMVVAVDFFNAGAMENKGLNIFNSKYVLADSKCATDTDIENILAVIGHEYFHNWTGDRVTCRDWFQLSLKEGLTVFRDQEFSSDLGCRPIERIKAVNVIRGPQFAEDAGPMAHPIRPDFVLEMNNFYSVTVYEKGAEVIRMIHTILGEENFQKGMKLYFKRHDGQAVTCEDFVKAMEDASGIDLTQFRNWYSQSGTPSVTVSLDYNQENQTATLHLKQSTPPTPNQEVKDPFVIPVSMALYTEDGKPIALKRASQELNEVQLLTKESESWVFEEVSQKPIVALFQNFSAPVKYDYPYTQDELIALLKFAKDPFVRFDSMQTLINNYIQSNAENYQRGIEPSNPDALIEAFKYILSNDQLDNRFKAFILSLPPVKTLMELFRVIDIDSIIKARKHLNDYISEKLKDVLIVEFNKLFEQLKLRITNNVSYECSEEQIGQRELLGALLKYYANALKLEGNEKQASELVYELYMLADNQTDKLIAMNIASNLDLSVKTQILDDFEKEWKDNPLVFDNYFRAVAMASVPNTLEKVKDLMYHKCFDINNPNRVRALVGTFASVNVECFHAKDGSGYRFLTSVIEELNSKNPHVAANLITPLLVFKRLDNLRRDMINECLINLMKIENLSGALYEKIDKALKL